MSSYVGPNGRIYKRKSNKALWTTLTILSMFVVAAVLFSFPHITHSLHSAGL